MFAVSSCRPENSFYIKKEFQKRGFLLIFSREIGLSAKIGIDLVKKRFSTLFNPREFNILTP